MERTHITYSGKEIIETTVKDISWDQVRAARNADLAACDWRAGKDVVLSTAWKEYRQALRDLPQDHAESNDAADSWPVKPDD